MKKNKINIAIIDDGINEKTFNTGLLKYNIEITPENIVKKRVIPEIRVVGHIDTYREPPSNRLRATEANDT